MVHETQGQQKWRLLTSAAQAENDFEAEHALRLTLLEAFYTRRRMEPRSPMLFPAELESLTGTPREHLEFSTWFLVQKNFLVRSDSSSLSITAGGVEYLEQHYLENMRRRRRLREVNVPEPKQRPANPLSLRASQETPINMTKPATVFLGEMTNPEVEAFLAKHHTVIIPAGRPSSTDRTARWPPTS